MKARVTVTLKAGVLDPQGQAIENSLKSLGLGALTGMRQGKVFDFSVDATDEAQAHSITRAACEKLLANTVIENYSIEIIH